MLDNNQLMMMSIVPCPNLPGELMTGGERAEAGALGEITSLPLSFPIISTPLQYFNYIRQWKCNSGYPLGLSFSITPPGSILHCIRRPSLGFHLVENTLAIAEIWLNVSFLTQTFCFTFPKFQVAGTSQLKRYLDLNKSQLLTVSLLFSSPAIITLTQFCFPKSSHKLRYSGHEIWYFEMYWVSMSMIPARSDYSLL